MGFCGRGLRAHSRVSPQTASVSVPPAPSSLLRPPGFHSYQEAIRLYETEEAYQGLPFTNDVLATLNYHTSVSQSTAWSNLVRPCGVTVVRLSCNGRIKVESFCCTYINHPCAIFSHGLTDPSIPMTAFVGTTCTLSFLFFSPRLLSAGGTRPNRELG